MFTYHESAVTPEFRDLVASHYAPTSRRRPCLRLLDHLLFGNVCDLEEGLLMLPHELLERFRNGTGKTHNFSARDLISKFERELFPVRFRPHSAIAKKVRLVEDIGFPDWLVEARDEMLRQPATARTVRLVSGEPVDFASDVLRLRAEALADAPPAKSAMAEDVLKYLNGLDDSHFSHLPARVPDALRLLEDLKPGSRIMQAGQLNGIHLCPKPLYKAVSNSARLYTAGPSFLNLKSSVRDVFTEGWIKLDLRQAQFAILSKLWEAEGFRNYLEGIDGSVWNDLMARAEIQCSSNAKGAVKTAAYAMLYGSREHVVRHKLAQEVGEDAARRFMRLPVVRLILTQREARYEKLLLELGITDAYGNRRQLEPAKNKREQRSQAMSMLACQAQSYELPILYPLIEYSRMTAGTEDPFIITAWLHDGVWASCKPESATRHLAYVKDLVRASSNSLLGFCMELDTEMI